MSLTYVRQSLRDRLWTLLESEPADTSIVRPQSRQKLETHAGWLRRFFDNQDPAAFPRIRMTDGLWTSSAFQEAQTFAEENIDFLDDEDASWPLKLGVEYIISLESAVEKTNSEDKLTEAVHV